MTKATVMTDVEFIDNCDDDEEIVYVTKSYIHIELDWRPGQIFL